MLGGVNLEADINKKWFGFAKIELEYDKFENLDMRTTAAAGLGYFAIREKDQELKFRGGVGYQHESFRDGTSDDEAIIELGMDYRKELAPWLLFKHGTTYYPTFDIGDYRIAMENAGEIPLGTGTKWKLKLGVRNHYNSEPQTGVDRLDTYYFANVVGEF